jgi:nucleotide-binding universal stress UspA family protein
MSTGLSKRRAGRTPVRNILHPTNLSSNNEAAFVHALRIAILNRANLRLLHVDPESKTRIVDAPIPSVRMTLEDWGLLPRGSHRDDVFKNFGVHVKKMLGDDPDVVRSIVNFRYLFPTDLMVLAIGSSETNRKTVSMAELLARKANVTTLFVPEDRKHFVCPSSGAINLSRVLIPVDDSSDTQSVIEASVDALNWVTDTPVDATVLRLDNTDAAADLEIQSGRHWLRFRSAKDGKQHNEILLAADETSADLIVMMMEKHDSLLNSVRSTVTAKVIRKTPCPVLAVKVLS